MRGNELAAIALVLFVSVIACAAGTAIYQKSGGAQTAPKIKIEKPKKPKKVKAPPMPAEAPPSKKESPEKPAAPSSSAPANISRAAQGAAIIEKSAPEKPPVSRGTVVFMIDDAGHNLRDLEPFLRYPWPLTIAVLPGLPYSAEAGRMIRNAGKELFLHQPMEALGGEDPGPAAIYTGMSEREVRRILAQNIAEIGPVAGINNHQGSRATEDAALMLAVLKFCRDNGIVFLDSRTTSASAVSLAARELGVKIASRDVFLDNDQSRPAIQKALEEGLRKTARQQTVIMIGHAWAKELAGLLTENHRRLERQGYTFSTSAASIN
jgi:polysaccharide deacetylase 2 family uncharacterized protein YibQ